MTNLSTQAQASIDAADEVFSHGGTIREGFAAALRALAKQSTFADTRVSVTKEVVLVDDILKIANELDNI